LLLALERRRIAFHPRLKLTRLWLAMMRLQQGFAAGGMGFDGQFASQKSWGAHIRFGSWLFSNSGRALAFVGDRCCGVTVISSTTFAIRRLLWSSLASA
jgi:hypothetical protein